MDDHLDSLLKRIIALEQETGSRCEADIITWRGMLTKIMVTPGDFMLGSGFAPLPYLEGGNEWQETNRLQLRDECNLLPSGLKLRH